MAKDLRELYWFSCYGYLIVSFLGIYLNLYLNFHIRIRGQGTETSEMYSIAILITSIIFNILYEPS